VLLRAETTEDAEIAEAKTSTTWVVIQTRSVETFEMASTDIEPVRALDSFVFIIRAESVSVVRRTST